MLSIKNKKAATKELSGKELRLVAGGEEGFCFGWKNGSSQRYEYYKTSTGDCARWACGEKSLDGFAFQLYNSSGGSRTNFLWGTALRCK